MDDINQVALLRKLLPTIDSPIVQIGSKQHANTSPFQKFHLDIEYLGLNAENGLGVGVGCQEPRPRHSRATEKPSPPSISISLTMGSNS